jgi:hypothetical protein
MDGNGLVASKKSEVLDIAKKYGVDRYIGTDRLAITEVLIKTWAEDATKDDPLTSHSKWVDTKSEIEDIIANTALQNNSRQSLYLLGATQTGRVSLNEVKTAYAEGWNTLMSQYSEALSHMSHTEVIDLERGRDRYVVTIPDYGTIAEKNFHSKAAASSLAQTEQMLVQFLSNTKVGSARNDIAERETTRSLLLTEAEAGMRDGGLTPGQYQQVIGLIGRGNSLYDGQIGTLEQFGNNPAHLMKQVDRTLRKAGTLISNRESRYALMGTPGFVTDPRTQQMNQILGRIGMTGDGIRSVKMEDQIMKTIPSVIGMDIASHANPAQTIIGNQVPPSPTIISKNNAKHSRFMNPSDVKQDVLSSRFSAYHQQRLQSPPSQQESNRYSKRFRGSPAQQNKLAGVYAPQTNRGLGGALDSVSDSKLVQLGLIAGLTFVGIKGMGILSESNVLKRSKGTSFDISGSTAPIFE